MKLSEQKKVSIWRKAGWEINLGIGEVEQSLGVYNMVSKWLIESMWYFSNSWLNEDFIVNLIDLSLLENRSFGGWNTLDISSHILSSHGMITICHRIKKLHWGKWVEGKAERKVLKIATMKEWCVEKGAENYIPKVKRRMHFQKGTSKSWKHDW